MVLTDWPYKSRHINTLNRLANTPTLMIVINTYLNGKHTEIDEMCRNPYIMLCMHKIHLCDLLVSKK